VLPVTHLKGNPRMTTTTVASNYDYLCHQLDKAIMARYIVQNLTNKREQENQQSSTRNQEVSAELNAYQD
jgi:uncharacterized protein YodC (DUF2158 family)